MPHHPIEADQLELSPIYLGKDSIEVEPPQQAQTPAQNHASQNLIQLDLSDQSPLYPQLGSPLIFSNLENAMIASQEQEVEISQEKLAQIRAELVNLLDSLDDRQSFISRLANMWAPLPLWKKICFGLLLSSPSLAIGIAANVVPLFAVTGFTLFTYLGGGMVLDNHHHCNQDTLTRIKTNVLSLSNMLEIVIVSLDNVRRYFQNEVEKFKKENNRFAESLRDFMRQTQILFSEVESLNATDQSLKQRREELELTIDKLKMNAGIDKQELNEYKTELFQVCENYKKNQLELTNTTSNLERVRNELKDQVDRAQKTTSSLEQALSNAVKLAVGGEERRQQFQKNLEELVGNKETNFDLIAARLCESEARLAADNVKHAELLSQEEMFIENHQILINALEEQLNKLKLNASKEKNLNDEREHDKENRKPKVEKLKIVGKKSEQSNSNQEKIEPAKEKPGEISADNQPTIIMTALNRLGLYARNKFQKKGPTELTKPNKGDLPSESLEEAAVLNQIRLESNNSEDSVKEEEKVMVYA